jgi:hypothetical protein
MIGSIEFLNSSKNLKKANWNTWWKERHEDKGDFEEDLSHVLQYIHCNSNPRIVSIRRIIQQLAKLWCKIVIWTKRTEKEIERLKEKKSEE